jgi:DNA-3-methyladenine glycosylase II
MTRPHYWPRARRALMAADPVLARIIRRHPRVALASRGDPFSTLARSIVGQQISVKAADAVWSRLAAACPQMSPAGLLRRRVTTLRSVGAQGRVPARSRRALRRRSRRAGVFRRARRRSDHRAAHRHPRHRPLDGRDVLDL